MTDLTKTLTPNEQAAALVLLQECLNGMGGEVPADLEGDEYTWCEASTLDKNGWTPKEAAGTFASLMVKGIISDYDEGAWVLQGWRDVATLWPLWVEAGKLASAIRGEGEARVANLAIGLIANGVRIDEDSVMVDVPDEDEDEEDGVNPEFESAMDEEEALIAALVQAGFDEQEAIDLGTPFPGIICSTLRSHAGIWKGTRGAFIKAVGLAGFNKNTAATQWQRAGAKSTKA